MRILFLNNYYYYRGGASIHAIKLAERLKKQGHSVYQYAMKHPKQLSCPETSDYWPSYIDYPEMLKEGIFKNGLRVAKRVVYSKEAESGLNRMIKDIGKFDIAHAHNVLHMLTPSVFEPLIRNNIPIVMTLHDYSLICANTSLFNDRTNQLCNYCISGGSIFWGPIIKRCKKNSIAASTMAAIEAKVHRIRGVSEKVNRYISPSKFLNNKFVEAGYDRKKIIYIPNFNPYNNKNTKLDIGEYAIYIGRLAPGKGVETLIKAWKSLSDEMNLKIVGCGPLENRLREMAKGYNNIEFTGFIEPEKLADIRFNAKFLIIPSEWWENAPLTIIEAFSIGLPVLGANIGGIPEMVTSGKTSELFVPGDCKSLAEKVEYMYNNDELLRMMGKKCFEIANNKYTIDKYIDRIEKLYREVINENAMNDIVPV